MKFTLNELIIIKSLLENELENVEYNYKEYKLQWENEKQENKDNENYQDYRSYYYKQTVKYNNQICKIKDLLMKFEKTTI